MLKINKLNEKAWREKLRMSKHNLYTPISNHNRYNNNRTRMSLHEKQPKFQKSLNSGRASVGDTVNIYLQYPKREIFRISKGEVMFVHNGFLVVKPLEPFTYTQYTDYTEVLLYFPSGIPTAMANDNYKSINLMPLRSNISVEDFIAKIASTDKSSTDFKKEEAKIVKYIKSRLDVPRPQYRFVELIKDELNDTKLSIDDIIVAMNEMLLTPEQVWDWYSYSKQNNLVYNADGIRYGGDDRGIETILSGAISSYFQKSATEYRRIIKNAIKIGKSKGYQTKVVIPEDGILNRELLNKGDWFRYYNLSKKVIERSKVIDYVDYDGIRLYFIASDKYVSLYSKIGVVVFNPNQGFSLDRVETTAEAKEKFLYNIKSAKERGSFDLKTELKKIEAYNLSDVRNVFK